MAQTGFTPILLYSSSTGGNAPAAADLTNNTTGSELAINITDGKLFYKDNANAVQVIGWKTTPTTAGGTGITSWAAGDLPYYASGTTLSKLGIGSSGQILTSTGTAPQWSTLSGVAVTTFSAGTTGLTPSSATSGAITLAGTLIAANGGTGQSSYAVGDILYASTTTALSRLADVATGNALISGGVGVAPSWGKIDLTTHVSGTLSTTNGGTGLSSFTANRVLYTSSTSAIGQSSNLVFDGTNLSIGGGMGVGTTANTSLAKIYLSGTSGTLPMIIASNTGTNNNASNVLGFTSDNTTYSVKLQTYRGADSSNLGLAIRVVAGGVEAEALRLWPSKGLSLGNTTDPGATNLSVTGTIASSSSITATTKVIGTTGVYSTTSTYSAASGSTITVLSMANKKIAGIITVYDAGGTRIGASGSFANYWDTGANNASVLWSVQNSGISGSALTLSGNDVQFTHTFGSTRTLTITILYYI